MSESSGRLTHDGRMLTYATLLYGAGLLLHTADHFRRGVDVLTTEVQWAGYLSTILGLSTIALVVMRHRLAPWAAAAAGIPVAVGVAAVHLLPHWSPFSDAFPGAHGTGVTALSWSVVLIEIAGALGIGLAGLALLRHSGQLAPRRTVTTT